MERRQIRLERKAYKDEKDGMSNRPQRLESQGVEGSVAVINPGKDMRGLRNIALITIMIGALITSGIMISTTSAVSSLSDLLVTLGFYVWVILPFIILIILTTYIHRKAHSSASRLAILLTSILVVVSSVLIYWVSIFNSESSTSALVFIFIPIYALVAIALVHGLSWLLLKGLMPKSKA
jgi:drug/metabolite transporter (DMT)-like permease